MGHALLNFLLTTVSMIALLYLVYLYIRGHVNVKPLQNKTNSLSIPSLHVESMVGLEPRKKLYVVRNGKERFMLASSMDKLELVSVLQPASDEDLVAEVAQEISSGQEENYSGEKSSLLKNIVASFSPVSIQAGENKTALNHKGGFKERFQQSIRMVLADRFGGVR